MKTWRALGITALLVAAVSWGGVVGAASFIDQRQARQLQRIQEGMQSGALTPREAARLQAEVQRIQAVKSQMTAKGRLTPNEKVVLDQMQDRADWEIYQLTHNHRLAHHPPGPPPKPPWRAEREKHWREKDRHPDWRH